MPEAKGNDTKDVVMEDVDVQLKEEEKKLPNIIDNINAELTVIVKACEKTDLRAIGRLTHTKIRKSVTGPILKRCVSTYVSAGLNPLRAAMLALLDKESDSVDPELVSSFDNGLINNELPDVTFYFAMLTLYYIWKVNPSGYTKEVQKKFANEAVAQLRSQNRRTLDAFGSRIIFYFSQIWDDDAGIRNDLLAFFRTSSIRSDKQTQGTTLNLVLRNYLEHNLFEPATQFVNKTTFPELRDNAEYARYLYYIGRMKAVQLDYSEAHNKLMSAIRKAPQTENKATGFKVAAWKLAITVQLLMGEIPERSTFTKNKEFRPYLKPYEEVTRAVRSGKLSSFQEVQTKYADVFAKDKTTGLIQRLHYNVIKTGLKSINLSYSRISLKDIAAKLGLDNEEDAAGIAGKGCVDGVINATLDYQNHCLVSLGSRETYSTSEPLYALHKRIAFCLQLHNDCVKGMEYPSAEPKKEYPSAETDVVEVIDDEDDIDMI